MSQTPHLLPDDTTLGPVRLQVADLARSLAWYEGLMGFRVVERSGDSAVLAAYDDPAPLVALSEWPGAVPVPRRGRLGLYHFAVLLPDRAALGRLVAHLAEHRTPAGASDHLVSEALYLTDPDGLGIEVYADRPRGEWRWRDGELMMSTAPLDLENLVAAAGAEPWTGMPAGTRIGHLHLHVGDLEQADAFYAGALGLAPMVRSYPGALFLSAGGYHHHLGVNTWAGAAAAPAAAGDARLLEWTVLVPRPGAEAAARRVEAAGHPVRASASDWLLTDPWGTSLRLVPRDAAASAGPA